MAWILRGWASGYSKERDEIHFPFSPAEDQFLKALPLPFNLANGSGVTDRAFLQGIGHALKWHGLPISVENILAFPGEWVSKANPLQPILRDAADAVIVAVATYYTGGAGTAAALAGIKYANQDRSKKFDPNETAANNKALYAYASLEGAAPGSTDYGMDAGPSVNRQTVTGPSLLDELIAFLKKLFS